MRDICSISYKSRVAESVRVQVILHRFMYCIYYIQAKLTYIILRRSINDMQCISSMFHELIATKK